MNLQFLRRRLLLPMVLLLAAVIGLPAYAITLDEAAARFQNGQRVYDFAGVLSTAEERQIHEQLVGMLRRDLASGVVVVADRLDRPNNAHDFARELAQRWRVGQGTTQNGFTLVVAVEQRQWELVTGTGLETTLPDATIRQIGTETLRPAFRQGQYGQGLSEMLSAVDQRLVRAGGAEALPTRDPAPEGPSRFAWFLTVLLSGLTAVGAYRAWPRGSRVGEDRWRVPTILFGLGALGWALLAATQAPTGGTGLIMLAVPAAGFAFFRLFENASVPVPLDRVQETSAQATTRYAMVMGVLFLLWLFLAPSWAMLFYLPLAIVFAVALPGYFRRAPRKCLDCAGPMRWLPEQEEHAFLRDEENVEQRLGSVDYDIWRCERCNRSAVTSKRQAGTALGDCPKCYRHTLAQRSVWDENSTAWDAWVTDISECHNPSCGYHEEKRRHVERPRSARRGGGWDDDWGGGGPGIIILPPIFGGGWGGGHSGDSGGWGGDSDGGGWSGIDLGGFDGGDFGGGGAGGDW